jgi:hypothetical protein
VALSARIHDSLLSAILKTVTINQTLRMPSPRTSRRRKKRMINRMIVAPHQNSPSPCLRVGKAARALSAGLTSAPIVPHFVHTMRGPNDGTVRSPGMWSTFMIVSCRH